MYHVYVLYSSMYDKIYIGYSSDAGARFVYHNQGPKKGWTARYRPWELVWLEKFETKKQAMKREKYLKNSRGRKWIRTAIIKPCWR